MRNNISVRIGSNNYLDLGNETVIATTLKRIDFRDLSAKYVDSTNVFKVKPTQNNNKILGWANNIFSSSPGLLRCTIVQNGIEIFTNCKAYVRKAGAYYEIQIIDDSFYDTSKLDKYSLRDINFSFVGGGWTLGFIDSLRLFVPGVSAGATTIVMDWGTGGYAGGQFLPSFPYDQLILGTLGKLVDNSTEGKPITTSFPSFVYSNPLYKNILMPYPGDKFTYATDTGLPPTVNTAAVDWANLMPSNVSLLDVYKDFLVRFGLIPNRFNNTLVYKTIEEIIIDKPNAVNWTGKRVNVKDEVDYQTSTFAQNNYFTNTGERYGRSAIVVNNPGLKDSADYYTSIFESVDTYSAFNNTINLNVFDATTALPLFKNKPPLTLVKAYPRTTEPAITFNVTPRTDYYLGSQNGMLWSDYLATYYPNLKAAMYDYKLISRVYRLTTLDIINYNHHRMMMDNGSYFLVESIDNFIPGELTKVKLLRVY